MVLIILNIPNGNKGINIIILLILKETHNVKVWGKNYWKEREKIIDIKTHNVYLKKYNSYEKIEIISIKMKQIII